MKHTDTELDKILEKLIASTRSPRGRFSAAASYPRLRKKLFCPKENQMYRRFPAMAASIALLCLLSWMAFYYLTPVDMQTISTTSSTRMIYLPDSSQVILNRYSSLSYPKRFKRKNRTVALTGEACFQVRKDKERPFTVEAEDIRVQVLGTHFNIKAYRNNPCIETTLIEGSISVGNRNKTASLILKPNEKAVYNKVEDRIIRKKAENCMDEISWIHGEIIFASTPLKEIAQELGNRFNVDIQIADTALQNYCITARFPADEPLDTILSILHEAGYFDYTQNNENITLTINSNLQ